jgi:hypothetical protein
MSRGTPGFGSHGTRPPRGMPSRRRNCLSGFCCRRMSTPIFRHLKASEKDYKRFDSAAFSRSSPRPDRSSGALAIASIQAEAARPWPIFRHVSCGRPRESNCNARRRNALRPNRELATAPVSLQKRPHRNATNAIERRRNNSKINEADRYSAAHNRLVAGSSPAGPTNGSMA